MVDGSRDSLGLGVVSDFYLVWWKQDDRGDTMMLGGVRGGGGVYWIEEGRGGAAVYARPV